MSTTIDTDTLREQILSLVEKALPDDALIPDRIFELATEMMDELAAEDEDTDCLHVNTDTQPDGTVLCNLCGSEF